MFSRDSMKIPDIFGFYKNIIFEGMNFAQIICKIAFLPDTKNSEYLTILAFCLVFLGCQ